MQTVLFAGKKTAELVSYFEANFPKDIVLSILFSEEDISQFEPELVILEESQTSRIPALLSLPSPPEVVIIGEGTSSSNLHYIDDLSQEFPKLLKSITSREPTLIFKKDNQKFVYRQKDIIAIIDDAGVNIHLRNGNKIIPRDGIRKVCSQLSDQMFFPVTKKMAANILYVSQMESNAVLMENGLRLPFSPQERQSVENAFYKIKFQETLSGRKKKATSSKKKKEI